MDTIKEIQVDVRADGVSLGKPVAWRIIVPAVAVGLVVAFVVGFELIYAGRVLPGVTADGIYVGGLSRADVAAAVDKGTKQFQGESLQLSNGTVIPVASLEVAYDTAKATDDAISYGRTGNWLQQIHAQLRTIFDRPTSVGAYTYNDSKLAAAVTPVMDAVATPVSNASLVVANNAASVVPARSGSRLDLSRLIGRINNHLALTLNEVISVPQYKVLPTVDTAGLSAVKGDADAYLAAPVTLTLVGITKTIDQATIASWLKVTSQPAPINLIPSYTLPSKVTIGLDPAAVTAYVSNLAQTVDQAPVNATLTIVNGAPVTASIGYNGRKLDQAAAVTAITAAMTKPADQRSLALNVATVKPDVGSDTLASLGINDLLSEGISYFTGSDANRLTNIRVGANRFNGVLLKPGQEFSFNAILGDVGPQFGYAPGYVILGNKEEKQYGGGLCQVSSTAYRAALLAGLPITARTNHSFAVPWYTAPFGVPGVDATIYLPDPDLKFVNDTGHYMLIQTVIQGNSLKFDFYGTKTKVGRIRGPYFVTGSMDDTKPSHTVFYRDILDLAGNVTHTDTVNTYYQSSLLFPIASATGN